MYVCNVYMYRSQRPCLASPVVFSTFFYVNSYSKLCVYMCGGMRMCKCRCSQSPGDGVRPCGAGVTEGRELSAFCTGNQTWVVSRSNMGPNTYVKYWLFFYCCDKTHDQKQIMEECIRGSCFQSSRFPSWQKALQQAAGVEAGARRLKAEVHGFKLRQEAGAEPGVG